MIALDGEGVAAGSGAEIRGRGAEGYPQRVVIDSREVGPGDLFVGLIGERFDGGEFGVRALEAGAWGALIGNQWAQEIAAAREQEIEMPAGWVFGALDPLSALQSLARTWRRRLGAKVVGITGSTGKTSVKDACAALLPLRVHASPENYNTEVGLPLAVLSAPPETEALVLEMGMRGAHQIAELAEIAEPDVGVITNVGHVHVELLGSIQAVAAAKAELIDGDRRRGRGRCPSRRRACWSRIWSGPSGCCGSATGETSAADEIEVRGGPDQRARAHARRRSALRVPLHPGLQPRQRAGCDRGGSGAGDAARATWLERAPGIVFSRLRGELVQLPGDSILINDCYNANPDSMRAALDDLAAREVAGRRIAVLGDMRELGDDAAEHHAEIGEIARQDGVELLIGVGELAPGYAPDVHVADAEAAAEALREALQPGDTVLVKGSRAVGLENVAEALKEGS